MVYSSFGSALAALSLAFSASAISTELVIVNAEVSPDGFARQGVLANGTFPGPIIKGHKVSSSLPLLVAHIDSGGHREITSTSM